MLLTLETDLNCVKIHNDYVHVLHSLCGDFLIGTFTLFISLCTVVLAIVVAKFMVCKQPDIEAEWRQAKLALKFEESPDITPNHTPRKGSVLRPLIDNPPNQGEGSKVHRSRLNPEQSIFVQVELPEPEYGSQGEAHGSLGRVGSTDIDMNPLQHTAPPEVHFGGENSFEHPFENLEDAQNSFGSRRGYSEAQQPLLIEDELPQVEYIDNETIKWVAD
eukprot:TRINITY_DN13284_c0_g1_i1.p1 TRINITY_DN13284_c0_g1~~TRINITY_DN13284_c0_g1_i1.p1  ORF type:complete len:218 (-),score=37.32 TRINITY_DN13284_c0_g1_i1:29-682(-)